MNNIERYFSYARVILKNIERNGQRQRGRRISLELAVRNFTMLIMAQTLAHRDKPGYDKDVETHRLSDIKAVYRDFYSGGCSVVQAMTKLCDVYNK